MAENGNRQTTIIRTERGLMVIGMRINFEQQRRDVAQ